MFSFFDTIHVSGSFKICTLSILINPVAPIVCNLVATPGRIGCLINTLICFKEGCGAVRFVWDQTEILECTQYYYYRIPRIVVPGPGKRKTP